MWHKQGILAVKREAYRYPDDEYIREHLTALNVYFNNYVGEKRVHRKNKFWLAMEAEADLIVARLSLLEVECL